MGKKKAIDLKFKDVNVRFDVQFKLGGAKNDKHKERQKESVPRDHEE